MENPTKMDDLGVPLFEEGFKKKKLTIPVDFHDIPMIFPLTINIPSISKYCTEPFPNSFPNRWGNVLGETFEEIDENLEVPWLLSGPS